MKPEFQLPDLTRASVKKYEVVVTDEMIDNEITRLRNRYGNMKDEETVTTEENVLNLNFVEIGEDGNDRPEGIKKDNSILVKYFREEFRKRWMGKKAGDSEMTDLRSAFDDKEREWIISDLGLKEDSDPGNRRFRIELTKIGLLEKRELQEDLFNQLYPNQDVKTEADFRNKIKEEIAAYWNVQAHNQIQDQVFHILVDQTQIQFPETFLKKWMRTQNEEMNSDEAVEKEFPRFLNQLKWTLIIDKVVSQQELKVTGDELRNFASQQLVSYMGGSSINPDEQWVKDYIDRMMKDKKYVEDSYRRIETQQVLEWAAGQVQPVPEEISAESFSRMLEEHRHHHH
jgi:trigger factor